MRVDAKRTFMMLLLQQNIYSSIRLTERNLLVQTQFEYGKPNGSYIT